VASLKVFEALVFRQQEQVNRDGTSSVTTPIWGASVDPPHTPSPNRFNLPENVNPTFRGAASFQSGNRPPGDTDTLVLTRTAPLLVVILKPQHLHLRPRGLSGGTLRLLIWHPSAEGIPTRTLATSNLILRAVLAHTMLVPTCAPWGGASLCHTLATKNVLLDLAGLACSILPDWPRLTTMVARKVYRTSTSRSSTTVVTNPSLVRYPRRIFSYALARYNNSTTRYYRAGTILVLRCLDPPLSASWTAASSLFHYCGI